jgi:HK97 family phage major capsid protein
MQNEVIELLSDRTIVRKLGARPVPLPNGNLTLPRVAGGATASYTGENKDAKTSESRFDDVKLSENHDCDGADFEPADWPRRF